MTLPAVKTGQNAPAKGVDTKRPSPPVAGSIALAEGDLAGVFCALGLSLAEILSHPSD